MWGKKVVDGPNFFQSLVSTDEWKQAAHSFIVDPLAPPQTVESSRGELKVMVNKGVNGERKRKKGGRTRALSVGMRGSFAFSPEMSEVHRK